MPSSSTSSDLIVHQDHNEHGLPQLILEEILDIFGAQTGNGEGTGAGGDRDTDGCNGWKLDDIQKVKSAQQKVFILTFSVCKRKNGRDLHQICQVPCQSNHNRRIDPMASQTFTKLIDDVQSGRNQNLQLVLRIWKGGSRWWNLNRNESPQILARAEIDGYRVASRSIASEQEEESANRAAGLPRIPQVLYVSECFRNDVLVQEHPCWALLEYVGPDKNDRLIFGRAGLGDHPQNAKEGEDNGNYCANANGIENLEKLRTTTEFGAIDRSYLNGMIKSRMEFGFDEPHPRWGRVPVDQALDYAKIILNEVLLPLHQSSRRLFRDQPRVQQDASNSTKSFSGMVEIYCNAWKDMFTSNCCLATGGEALLQKELQTESEDNPLGGGCGSDRIQTCLQRLKLALDLLSQNADATILPPLDPVLVHMDLQPQNLIFCRDVASSYHHNRHPSPPLLPYVFSVLDWEDAAWADPRFDLLLLCRKVCANRDQADALWLNYERTVLSSKKSMKRSIDKLASFGGGEEEEARKKEFLGPIEPWLRLETVHSITTMLLQSMDLVNGGRNPWETKQDLWQKLQREFARLEDWK